VAKDACKSFLPDCVKAILWILQEKIKEMERGVEQEGVAAIYPSGDDVLD
jgi:hypothetical protein